MSAENRYFLQEKKSSTDLQRLHLIKKLMHSTWHYKHYCCFLNLGVVTYRFSYAKRHNDAGGGGTITNDVLKFRKIIEFQSS